jgi:DNA-binding GntR family transcriptional regulator
LTSSSPCESANESADRTIEQSVADRLLTAIRDDIIAGKLPPGTPLVENDLTQAHGVSRNTLREALRLLCHEGLAVHYRHRGVIVRTLTRHDVRDIYRVRRTLELQALARDEPIGDDDLAAMRNAVAHSASAARDENWRCVGTYSLLFHRRIVHLLGSPLFDTFFMTILAQLRLVFASAPDEQRFQRPWVAKDQHLIELVSSGRTLEAGAALADYLKQSEDALLDYL